MPEAQGQPGVDSWNVSTCVYQCSLTSQGEKHIDVHKHETSVGGSIKVKVMIPQ